MAAMPAHELDGRGTSVLVKYNRFAPNWVSVGEVANPRDLISVNILEDDRSSPRFYVPDVVITASTVIEHDNHGEVAPMILRVVMISAATVIPGMMARSAPLAIVRIVIPVVPLIIAVSPMITTVSPIVSI